MEFSIWCPTDGTVTVGLDDLAMLDDAWVRVDDGEPTLITLRREGSRAHAVPEPEPDGRVEAYCEYFRRELDDVETVEDILAEIDQRERS